MWEGIGRTYAGVVHERVGDERVEEEREFLGRGRHCWRLECGAEGVRWEMRVEVEIGLFKIRSKKV